MQTITPVRHLYAHIPFCPKKCEYCAFVTHIGSLRLLDAYVDALREESRTQSLEREGGPLDTIYFGGGTPTMLGPERFAILMGHFRTLWGASEEAEVTLEAHPDTVDAASLLAYREAGATRLSFGAESMVHGELRALGREHSVSRAGTIVRWARAAGFPSVNIDLMYGIPGQTMSSWRDSLQAVLALEPDHLSLYPLSIEPKTVFHRKQRSGALEVPEDDMVVNMYREACLQLRAHGFDHYEVANWARHGHQCRHNLAYWGNADFYAVGVGAHGFLRPHRFQNVEHTAAYIAAVSAGESPRAETTHVDSNMDLSDTVVLALRLLLTGVHLDDIRERFGVDVVQRFPDTTDLLAAGLLRLQHGHLLLPESSVPIANEIWERFIA